MCCIASFFLSVKELAFIHAVMGACMLSTIIMTGCRVSWLFDLDEVLGRWECSSRTHLARPISVQTLRLPVCVFFPLQDHFRAKIRIVLSKLCRKFGFEEIKRLMPEQDKKLVAHMQTTAEREIKAKKARLGGRGVEDNAAIRQGSRGSSGGGGGEGEAGISKALRTFDAIMEGKLTSLPVCPSVFAETMLRRRRCCYHISSLP